MTRESVLGTRKRFAAVARSREARSFAQGRDDPTATRSEWRYLARLVFRFVLDGGTPRDFVGFLTAFAVVGVCARFFRGTAVGDVLRDFGEVERVRTRFLGAAPADILSGVGCCTGCVDTAAFIQKSSS
jgi:hypothetical protein